MNVFNRFYNIINNKQILDKYEILRRVNQKEIFELVFHTIPNNYRKITSPFREDSNPGCWFEEVDGILLFRDFAYGNKPLDCFEAVEKFYNLINFQETLLFIENKIKLNTNSNNIISNIKSKNKTEIYIDLREFDIRDRQFWNSYSISKENLKEDKVYAIRGYMICKNFKRTIHNVYSLCYAYTDFQNNKKKLYRPNKKDYKFITNCNSNDIGGINKLSDSDKLIITKSYKDYRVLKNLELNVVWFQNEVNFPNKENLSLLFNNIKQVTIFYDNDNTGLNSSKRLEKRINTEFSNIITNCLYIPYDDIKDPSDLVKEKGSEVLNEFINGKYR